MACGCGWRRRLPRSVTHEEVLAVAPCYGWIDGQKNSDADQTWLQQFCPRLHQPLVEDQPGEGPDADRKRDHAAGGARKRRSVPGRTGAGETPGIRQVALACRVICPQHRMQIFGVKAWLEGLDRQNRYRVLFRIPTVKKSETPASKIREFVEMLERNGKIQESGRPKRSRK